MFRTIRNFGKIFWNYILGKYKKIYLYICRKILKIKTRNMDLIHSSKTFWNYILGKYKKYKRIYMYKNLRNKKNLTM